MAREARRGRLAAARDRRASASCLVAIALELGLGDRRHARRPRPRRGARSDRPAPARPRDVADGRRPPSPASPAARSSSAPRSCVLVALVPDAVAIVSAVTQRPRRTSASSSWRSVRRSSPCARSTASSESLLGLFSARPRRARRERGRRSARCSSSGTFLTFFLVQDGDRGWAWLMRSLDPWRAATVTASAERGVDKVGWYIRRTALLATLDALVVWVVLTAAGVPARAGARGGRASSPASCRTSGRSWAPAIIALAALALGGPVAAVAVLGALLATSLVAARLLDGDAARPHDGRPPAHRAVRAARRRHAVRAAGPDREPAGGGVRDRDQPVGRRRARPRARGLAAASTEARARGRHPGVAGPARAVELAGARRRRARRS